MTGACISKHPDAAKHAEPVSGLCWVIDEVLWVSLHELVLISKHSLPMARLRADVFSNYPLGLKSRRGFWVPFFGHAERYPMNNIKTETVRASINERKLFETMGNWFATSFSIVGEVMQNARRAGASTVSFVTNYDENSLVVTDDGCGIDNFQNLIELATSGWTDEKIQLVDKPFGMGLFSLFYACDTVIFRSRSMKLVICLEDIITKRELQITVDEDQIFTGTKIHLLGLKPKLLAEAGNNWPSFGAKLARRWELDEQILNAAKGFEIPVMLNGLVIPQPFAARNLKMDTTSIGLVHLIGIHTDSGKIEISGYNGRNSIDYFLQGLPIEKSSRSSEVGNVVHLNANFIAVMPDRAKLQDADKQLESVQVVLKNLVENHVIRMKFSMPPRDFVKAYFDVASENGFTWLFNDVPYLPSRHFTSVEMVSDDSNMVYVGAGLDADLVSRDDLLGGTVLAWRDAPSCASDSPWAAAMLKYMLVSKTLEINVQHLSKAHWIFEAVPTTVDFTFRVEASGVQGKDTLATNTAPCELVLVDLVTLIINSKTDSSFELVHEFNKDWLVVPVNEDEDEEDFDYGYGQL